MTAAMTADDELRAQRPNITAADRHTFDTLKLAAADVAPTLLDDPVRMTRLLLEIVDLTSFPANITGHHVEM